jgi:TolB protein
MSSAWSPDGSTIAFTSDRHAEASSPAARRLLGMDEDEGDFEIYLMERDGSNVRRLTEHGGADPAWSPDGQRIAFSGHHRSFWVMNADGRNQRRLINDRGFRPAWSPDGSQISFSGFCDREIQTVSPQWEKFEICVMRADGSGSRALTQNEVFDGHTDWW